jgi:hypothetical protein
MHGQRHESDPVNKDLLNDSFGLDKICGPGLQLRPLHYPISQTDGQTHVRHGLGRHVHPCTLRLCPT